MKKLVIAAIAAVFAVMLVAPVYAADNLELSGDYRLRMWSIDNKGFTKDNDQDYIDQRLRMKSTINVADDVKAVLRADYAEGTWGDGYTLTQEDYNYTYVSTGMSDSGWGGPNEDNEIGIDRAYLQIDKEFWGLTVGEQWVGLGHTAEAVDMNPTAMVFDIKPGPATISLIYAKVDEGLSDYAVVKDGDGSLVYADKYAGEDTDLYGVNGNFAIGGFDANAFFAMVNSDMKAETVENYMNWDGGWLGSEIKAENEPWVIGFSASGAIGDITLTGELDYFGGDYYDVSEDKKIDYVGTQMYLGAEYALSDMISIGGEVLYALGTDDADEEQETHLLYDYASFCPGVSNTPLDAEYAVYKGDSPYALEGNTGVQALTVYADATPMEKLSVGTKMMYAQPEEDSSTVTEIDDVFAFNAYVAYEIATNTVASLTYLNDSVDYDDNTAEETENVVMAQIKLSY